MQTPIQLYLSIPFCLQHCAHCQKSIHSFDQTLLRAYGIALEREIAAAGESMEDHTVRSVYFGGGTPPIITARVLRQLLAAIRRHFNTAPDMDVELELVPGNFTEILCVGMSHDGLTHMICGVSTFQMSEWEMLDRPYDYAQSMNRMNELLETHRPPHLTLSIHYGLPEQTEKRLTDTVRRTISYKPQCIRLEPITAAEDRSILAAGKKVTPLTAEEKLARFQLAEDLIVQAGYRRYSLREYALPGGSDRFQEDTMQDMERLGLGVGAISHYDGIFYRNTLDLNKYYDHSAELDVIAEDIFAPDEDWLLRRRTLLTLSSPAGLSTQGLSGTIADFAQEQIAVGNVREEDGHLRLTARGIVHWDEIAL